MPAHNRPREFDLIARRIQEALVQHTLPSFAVAVAHEGEILWEEAFGLADRETMTPATEHTLYSIASVSKPMTATALMVLVERGLVDLDRPINDYLGDAQIRARVGDAREATVRRIANHTAGLPVHYNFFYEDEPTRPPSMDETILHYGNLVTGPAERFKYSNLGYGILDYVIARVSGTSYADFLRKEVFLPLGLHRSAVGVPPELAPFAAKRYGADNVAYPAYDFDHRGGSAVYASAHDLVRFGMFHLRQYRSDQKAILTDRSLDEMQVATAQQDDDAGYGIGWRVCPTWIEHDGGMGGVSALLRLVPTAGIVVAAVTNSSRESPLSPGRIVEDVVNLLLPPTPGTRNSEPASSVSVPSGPTDLLGIWRGTVHTYGGDMPFQLNVLPSGEMHAQLGQQLEALVNSVTYENGYLNGEMVGEIGTPDAYRRPHFVWLDLKRRDNVLTGALIAVAAIDGRGGTPQRLGHALNHWAELSKTDT
ncbi:MAG: serine hydrolase domain-containing protein [Dehalococcoidia bacterium]